MSPSSLLLVLSRSSSCYLLILPRSSSCYLDLCGPRLACAKLCSGFVETDPESFNNTVAEKQTTCRSRKDKFRSSRRSKKSTRSLPRKIMESWEDEVRRFMLEEKEEDDELFLVMVPALQ
uniref:Uncharacterized protein n=1 Tax=Setaria viridis TaxID=4556 RepID=A0A4U6VUD5_SETVI|nr:hypothetical protein SEVIR_2G244401v2 [Setaria viridis]TKW33551.1 hypothetical protein SEVIR_2G244401v2 [Setaria viridis]